MVSALVSGKQKKSRTQVAALMMRSSYIDQRQVLSVTEKPDKSGPRAGPAKAAVVQNVRPYGILWKPRISAADAPPVASTGPPRKP